MSKIYTDKWIDKTGVTRYFQDADATEKLAGIEDGAQENTIETISVNDQPLTPDENKNINLDIAIPVKGVSVNETPVTPDEHGTVDITVPTGTAANKDYTSIVRKDDMLVTGTAVLNYIDTLDFNGHTIIDENNIPLAQRKKLKFINADIVDDSAANETIVSIVAPDPKPVDTMEIVQSVIDLLSYQDPEHPDAELLVDYYDVVNYAGAGIYSYGEIISYEPSEG